MAVIIHLASDLPEQGLFSMDVGVVKQSDSQSSTVFFPASRKAVSVANSALVPIDPARYGDGFDEKICNVCHRILPTSFFDANQNGKGDRVVRRPSCKDCRKHIDGKGIDPSEKRRWQASKPEYVDFECPVCQKITIPPVTSKVVLNHSHATGEVVGWICDSCNTGLGRFKDDTEVLLRAAEYLEQH